MQKRMLKTTDLIRGVQQSTTAPHWATLPLMTPLHEKFVEYGETPISLMKRALMMVKIKRVYLSLTPSCK